MVQWIKSTPVSNWFVASFFGYRYPCKHKGRIANSWGAHRKKRDWAASSEF